MDKTTDVMCHELLDKVEPWCISENSPGMKISLSITSMFWCLHHTCLNSPWLSEKQGLVTQLVDLSTCLWNIFIISKRKYHALFTSFIQTVFTSFFYTHHFYETETETYRQHQLRWSCLVVLLLLDFVPMIAWPFPTLSLWWFRLRLCRTGRRPLWILKRK